MSTTIRVPLKIKLNFKNPDGESIWDSLDKVQEYLLKEVYYEMDWLVRERGRLFDEPNNITWSNTNPWTYTTNNNSNLIIGGDTATSATITFGSTTLNESDIIKLKSLI